MRFAPLAGLAIGLTAAAPAMAQPVPDEPLRYIDELPAAPGSPAAQAGVPTTWPEPAKAARPKPKLVETAGGVAGSVVGQTLGTAVGGPVGGIAAGMVGGRLGTGAVKVVKKVFRGGKTPAPPPVEQAAAATRSASEASANAPEQPSPQGEDFKVRGEPYPDPPPEAEPPPG
jgi:hypothetical protein